MSKVKELFPIANLEGCKRLLCIQPHPDDNEIAAGGTIAKLVASGCEVVYLTATDGSLGSHELSPSELAAVRAQEIANVTAELGVKRSLSLGFRDYIRESVQDIAIRVVEAIREVQPQMVMTVDPWMPYEAHPDHRKVGMAVADAMIFSGFELYPDIQNGKTFPAWGVEAVAFYHTTYPNTVVDVTDYMDIKFRAVAHNKSQFDAAAIEHMEKYLRLKASDIAEGQPFEYGEAFKVLKGRHLHCFTGAINT